MYILGKKWFKKEAKSITDENKELDEKYKNMLFKSRVKNFEDGNDSENLIINKNLVLMSEKEKNEAELRKAESQTQSKLVNGIQVGCTVVSTAAAIGLWKKEQNDPSAARSEVGKTIANYGRSIMGVFRKK